MKRVETFDRVVHKYLAVYLHRWVKRISNYWNIIAASYDRLILRKCLLSERKIPLEELLNVSGTKRERSQ